MFFFQGLESLLEKLLSRQGPDSLFEVDPYLCLQGLDSLLGTLFAPKV